METFAEGAIAIIDEMHTERLDYTSEYVPLINAAQALAAYEDTGLSPEEISIMREKLSCYEKAEQEGRLVIVPDKLCDLIYDEEAPEKSYIAEYRTEGVAIKFAGDYICLDELGKTVFPTKEEAEAALKESENSG